MANACVNVVSLLVLLVVVVAEGKTNATTGNCTSEGCATVAGFVLQNLDQSIDPCTDFYAYACGKFVANTWLLDNVLDASTFPKSSSLSHTRNVRIQDSFGDRIEKVVDKTLMPDKFPTRDADQKAALFYSTCIEASGDIDDISSLNFVNDVFFTAGGFFPEYDATWTFPATSWSAEQAMVNVLPYLTSLGLIGLKMARDDYNSSRYALILSTPTPTGSVSSVLRRLTTRRINVKSSNRDYVKQAYVTYLRRLSSFLITGYYESNAALDMNILQGVADFELDLITLMHHFEHDHGNDTDERLTWQTMFDICPSMNWMALFNSIGHRFGVESLQNPNPVLLFENVSFYTGHRKYLKALCQLLTQYLLPPHNFVTGAIVVQNYLAISAITPYMSELSPSFRRPYEEFLRSVHVNKIEYERDNNSRTRRWMSAFSLERRAEQLKTVMNCRTMAKEFFGLVISRRYVEMHFNDEIKTKAESIAEKVRHELVNIVGDSITWMDERTKRNAKHKVESILIQIGYPEHLMDNVSYSNDGWPWLEKMTADLFITNETNHLQNLFSLARHSVGRELSRLERVPERKEYFYLISF